MTKPVRDMMLELIDWYKETFDWAKDMSKNDLWRTIKNMGIRELHAQMETEIAYVKMMDGEFKFHRDMAELLEDVEREE